MRFSFFLSLAGCLILASAALSPAFAQPEKPGAETASSASSAPSKPSGKKSTSSPAAKGTPTPIDALRDYTIALIEGMSEDELRYLYIIRTRHGVGRAVEIVRRDVGQAVEKCGQKHPDMKADMKESFSAWGKAVDPLLEESTAALKKAIAAQTFLAPAKIEKLLDLVNEAGAYSDKQVVKEIVTTQEACTTLLNSMSETRDHLSRLLRETLSSLPSPESRDAAPPPKESGSETPKSSAKP